MLDAPSSYADLHRYGDALTQAGWAALGFKSGRHWFGKDTWLLTILAGPVAVGAEMRICRKRE